jgi:hypothetical protein
LYRWHFGFPGAVAAAAANPAIAAGFATGPCFSAGFLAVTNGMGVLLR